MAKVLKWKWLIALGMLLASVWLMVIPPFQASDESVHFGESMRWGLFLFDGLRGDDLSQTCSEFLFPTLEAERVSGLRFNPLSSYAAPLTDERHQYAYIYDHGCRSFPLLSLAYILFAPFLYLFPTPLMAFYGLRGLSWLLFGALLLVMYRLGQHLFKDESDRLLWLMIPILSPIYVLMSVAMSYESLLYLWFGLLYWVVGKHVLNPQSTWSLKRQMLVLMGLSLVAIFTKISGVYVPLFALGALVLSKRLSPQHYISLGAGMIGFIGFILMATNFLPNWSNTFLSLSTTPFFEFLGQLTVVRWSLVFESFWVGGGFGWLDTYAHPLWLLGLAGLTFGGLLGSAHYWWRHRKTWRTTHAWLTFCWLSLISFELLAMLYNLPFALDAKVEAFGYIQGRFYYPLMVPFSYLLIVGWQAILKTKQRWRYGRLWIVLALFAFHFYYLGAVVIPRFYF